MDMVEKRAVDARAYYTRWENEFVIEDDNDWDNQVEDAPPFMDFATYSELRRGCHGDDDKWKDILEKYIQEIFEEKRRALLDVDVEGLGERF